MQLLELGRRFFPETELGFQHNALAQVARPVLEGDLLARNRADLALGIEQRHLGHDLGELGAMAAGIHIDAAAHGARDPDEALDAGEPGLRGAPGQQRRRHTGADDRDRALHFKLVEALPHPDHEAGETAVLDEHVGAEAEYDPRHVALPGQVETADQIVDVGGQEEIAGWPADVPRGVA